jgi:uncharacterized protein YjbJ (UPF0337 family)
VNPADTNKALKKENKMKASTNDQLEGKTHEVKGATKEMVGKVTANPKLEGEGKLERVTGKIQRKIGQAEKFLEK